MLNDVDELDALAEILIPVLASIKSCRANEFWRKTYGNVEGNGTVYVCGEYEIISDATMLFSLISLRKIDEFLSNAKKKKTTDIRYSDFGICREDVLLDSKSIVSQDVRNSINTSVAHFTDFGDPSVEDWEEFGRALKMSKAPLKRLEEIIEKLLKFGDLEAF